MATATKKLTVIPAKNKNFLPGETAIFQKQRVAAYGRVSTDSDEQHESFEAQLDHYSKHIQQNPEWEFVNFYGDEARSGTSTKQRTQFNQMIADAMAGKIEYIITKSISRFARNTLDTLTNVRMLKEKGIGIFFETQNINTLDSKGEVLLTILAALAQDEIRCLSENVAWGKRKRFADGEVIIPTKRFLGFEKDADGNIVINENEAKTVRLIYKLFIDGKTPNYIKKTLEQRGIAAPGGGDKWHSGTIISILKNEKYQGDSLLQKCYVPDFLTKKSVKNDGALPQYYVENSHPAIVSKEIYSMAEQEFKRREEKGGKHLCGDNPLTGKIICGECGGYFGSKVWHSTSQYRRIVWRCNEKYKAKGAKQCSLPHINEDTIKTAFVEVFNGIFNVKDEVLSNLETIITETLTDEKISKAITSLQSELENLELAIKALIDQNATTRQNQDDYIEKYKALSEQHRATSAAITSHEAELQHINTQKQNSKIFLHSLQSQEQILIEFDEPLWILLVESVMVHEKQLVFKFKNGMEVTKTL